VGLRRGLDPRLSSPRRPSSRARLAESSSQRARADMNRDDRARARCAVRQPASSSGSARRPAGLVEGLHGVRLRGRFARLRETVEIVRFLAFRGDPLRYAVSTTFCRCPARGAIRLRSRSRPTRTSALSSDALAQGSRLTGSLADGWLAHRFHPRPASATSRTCAAEPSARRTLATSRLCVGAAFAINRRSRAPARLAEGAHGVHARRDLLREDHSTTKPIAAAASRTPRSRCSGCGCAGQRAKPRSGVPASLSCARR